MVTVTLYHLINYLHSSLNTSSLALLLQKPRKLFHDKRKLQVSSSPPTSEKTLRILYPTRLKHQDGTSVDMVAVTDFFSPTTSSTSDTSSIATNTTITNQAVHNLNIPVTPGYRAPREPIVLCHGLYGFDLWGPEAFPSLQLHYWCGIEDALAKLGAKVVVSRVPKAGSIKERAHTLHTVLQQIMHHKKVNFIAHSMGGLDCRYLISHIRQRQYDVQSLSTVCTPHRGSSLMDWFRNHVGVGKNLSDSLLDGALKQNNPMQTHRYWNAHSGSSISALKATMRYEENQPLTLTSSSPGQFWQPAMQKLVQWFDAPAYANLTTDFCKYHFNPNTPDDRRVAYYSYGAAADIPAWSSMLGMPWNYMQKKEGDNDGIVSVQSAKWGQYVKTLEADHWDLSGESHVPYRWRTGKEKFDRIDFYVELADRLYQQGH